ncbi:NPCBM/NEW2 domain-containing protein [Candidatus Poribacteria bacterium]
MIAAKQLISSMVVFLFLITSYTYAGTITVNSLADTDARGDDITLREAIMLSEGELNFALLSIEEQIQVSTPVGRGIADTINFGMSGTIILRSDLPAITDDGTVIDASSQWVGEWPGGEPGVVLSGGWNRAGLEINGAANCHIRGLFITECVVGIAISVGAQFNTIGGPGTGNRNVISGNGRTGVEIDGNGTDRNVVSGNYMGTDVTGTADLGNSVGVQISNGTQWNTIGGTTAAERNIISGNHGWTAIAMSGSGTNNNAIKGNYIGTDVTGTVALGNSEHGCFIGDGAQFNIIGGTTAGERNIISGNNEGIGVLLDKAANNTVSGNYIGTDITGTTALGNGTGVWVYQGAQSNTFGGTTEGERNLISGNGSGIHFRGLGTNRNVVIGNFIGTDFTGTMGLENQWEGVAIGEAAQSNIIGSADAGNTIAFNGGDGVSMEIGGTYFNKVSGNSIHHNGHNGVRISYGPQSNIIGGVGAGNIIADNGENGILIEGGGSDFNRISANSIHDNADLGIELVWGGNDEIQPPNVMWGGLANGILTVSGDGAGSDATVEIFIPDSSDEEGETYLGSVIADENGEFLGSMLVTGNELAVGDQIVATTIHIDNNTSEFSSTLNVSERQLYDEMGQIFNPANGHYYEVIVSSGIDWDDAREAAESRTLAGLRGHLATITSQAENDFLLSIRPPSDINLWVGGFQPPGSPEPDGNWKWLTGEPFVYENWATDEPNNPYGNDPNEDSLEFQQDGKWNDGVGIWDSGGYIVEYRAAAIPLLPFADFSANVTLEETPLAVTFTDLSRGSPTNWWWDFGDGATSELQNPTHTYNEPGDYRVSLTVANATGVDAKTGLMRISGIPCMNLLLPDKEIPYEETVEADMTPGVVYLSAIGGDTPIPNACGLNAKNDPVEWIGWGGPIDADNAAIGGQPGERHLIVIGGVLFERGIGTHAEARFVFDLTGGNYFRFECYAGISDEEDSSVIIRPGEDASCDFIFMVDGAVMARTGILRGHLDEENVPPERVEFDIPPGAKELSINITDGGDGTNGDLACLGDARLIQPEPRVLSISSIDAPPGTSAVAELRIDDAAGLASGDMVIEYDAGVITVDEVIAADLLSGILLIANADVPGEIRLSMAGATGIPEGSGALVEISLTVSVDAEIGTQTVLDFGDARIYDESGLVIPVRLENGVVKVTQPGIKGDVNNDGAVRSNDATLALRIAAQLMIPTEYQFWAADMNDDGAVRANDATLILRTAAGLAAPGRDVIASAGRHINVMLSEAHGIGGERVTVPIKVDNADMLASGEICIVYDSTVLRAVDVLAESGALMVSNATEPGILRIAFASANRLNSQTIAEIQFDVLADTLSLLKFRTVELYGPDTLLVNSKGIDKEFRPWAMVPKHNSLLQNFPNPFNPETWIPYQLSEDSEVTVRIYSATGQLIRKIDLGYREAGSYVTRDAAAYWDGKSEAGERVASGVYFYSIQAGGYGATRKMTVAQ